MICPKCGSCDVEFDASLSEEIHHCLCNNCGNEWEDIYDYSSRVVK